MPTRRGRLEIHYDILTAIRDEIHEQGIAGLTRVQNRANLPWERYKEHIQTLTRNGLIQLAESGPHQKLELTEKGRQYLRESDGIVKFLRRFALDTEAEES